MAEGKINVTFYHSVVCPRCQVSGLVLGRLLGKYPDVEVTKVEFLTNRDRAREDGVRSIPALVAEGRLLSGIILTPGRIQRFFESLAARRA